MKYRFKKIFINKKAGTIYFLFILIIVTETGMSISCKASHEFIRTGPVFSAIGENADIQIFSTNHPEKKFVVIGRIIILHPDLNQRIETAKQIARENGGNAVITGKVTESNDGTTIRQVVNLSSPGGFKNKISPNISVKQEFIIIKIE
jgi:hypothetical protein